jgi:ABC-type transport system involved in cytochrome bd biosynthesis fused ATPase/permease subunit
LFDRSQPWTLVVATKNAALMRQCDTVYEVEAGRVQARVTGPLLVEGA